MKTEHGDDKEQILEYLKENWEKLWLTTVIIIIFHM